MRFEIPQGEIRQYQQRGFLLLSDLLYLEDAQSLKQHVLSAKKRLPHYAHTHLPVSTEEILILSKKRQLASITAQLLQKSPIRLSDCCICKAQQALSLPESGGFCGLILSLDHLWGCFYKEALPFEHLPEKAPSELCLQLILTSNYQDQQQAPQLYP